SVLRYSSDLYFVDRSYYDKYIIPFLNNVNPYCLAAICYVSDFYHIRKFNDSLIRNMLDEIVLPITKETTNKVYPSEETVGRLKSVDENLLNFVHQIFFSQVKGLGKDYDKMPIELSSNILYTSYHVYDTLNKYRDFFKAFFLTTLLPNNANKLKFMRRRTVVLSDTDSTCFTLDEWVKWYSKEFIINDKTIAIASSVAFMATQTIIHLLALLSTNLRISKDELHTLAMKNEFLWTVHMPVEVSKHYAAYTVMKEGNVYSKPELEIKGIHLKNSAIPKFLIADAKQLLEDIFITISDNRKIKLNDVIAKIKDIEKNIKDSVYKGETLFLKKSKIKNKEAYALSEELSPYQRHTFWEDVFSNKYGSIELPPYDAIKIPTIVTSKTALKEWIESIEDPNVKIRLSDWLIKYKKPSLPTIYLNETYVLGHGIPKEIIAVIDIKRIIMDITIQHRMILQSLGVMLMDDLSITEQF
ncbi:MAG: hypothetical protein ACD_33C00043G0001, partial [uncultured bacterium]